MKQFAKTFQSEVFGQILVVRRLSDEGNPEVQLLCMLPGMDLCTFSLGFNDTNAGESKRDAFYDNCDLAQAEDIAGRLLAQLELGGSK